MYYAAPCISQTSLVIDGLNTAKLYNFQLKTDANYVLQYATRPTSLYAKRSRQLSLKGGLAAQCMK